MPNSVQAFDNKKIKLYSDEGAKNQAEFASWKNGLKASRWYGPFVWEQEQKVIIFHSVTAEGFFDGVALGIEISS